ncbi:unnamed protein product, partial [Protopolystoma xenopodis]
MSQYITEAFFESHFFFISPQQRLVCQEIDENPDILGRSDAKSCLCPGSFRGEVPRVTDWLHQPLNASHSGTCDCRLRRLWWLRTPGRQRHRSASTQSENRQQHSRPAEAVVNRELVSTSRRVLLTFGVFTANLENECRPAVAADSHSATQPLSHSARPWHTPSPRQTSRSNNTSSSNSNSKSSSSRNNNNTNNNGKCTNYLHKQRPTYRRRGREARGGLHQKEQTWLKDLEADTLALPREEQTGRADCCVWWSWSVQPVALEASDWLQHPGSVGLEPSKPAPIIAHCLSLRLTRHHDFQLPAQLSARLAIIRLRLDVVVSTVESLESS